jgi:apolipoprotein N-acyltransferase
LRHLGVPAFALALAHAVLFACAYPPLNLGFLAFVSPAPLALLAIRARSTVGVLLVVLVVQFLLWSWMDRWLIPVTVAGYPVLALYMSIYGCLFVWIVRRISRHPRLGRWPMTLVVPVVWVGLECLRGELAFHGYPWYLLAHPIVEQPALAQSADLFGTYFVSFLAATAAGALVDLACRQRGDVRVKFVLPAIGAAVILNGLNIGYGIWRLGQAESPQPDCTILAIQTNLPQDNKLGWPPEEQRKDVPAFIDLTRTAFEATGGEADVVVWPETMLPVRGLEMETLQTLWRWRQNDELRFADAVIALSAELKRPMLVGSLCHLGLDVNEERQWVWDTQYNSAYLIDQDLPEQRYDKFFLTPFGETMPYISAWPWLEEKLLGIGAGGMSFGLSSNPDIQLIRLELEDMELRLGTPICFEDTMARVCRRMAYEDGRKRLDVLVNLSNDGWYGDFDAGRVRHAQIARFRCIENRVPMVRCANTGLSVSIDSSGRIISTVGEGPYGQGQKDGWLAATVSLDQRATLYGRIGDLWSWACLLLCSAMFLRTFFGRRKG